MNRNDAESAKQFMSLSLWITCPAHLALVLLLAAGLASVWPVAANSVVTIKSRKECVRSLAIDPRHPSTIYAGTEMGVCKSVDGGRHWSRMDRGLGDVWISLVRLAPGNSAVLYAVTLAQVYKSENGGKSWALSDNGLENCRQVQALAFDPADSSVLYAGADDGLYRSVDAGAHWVAIASGVRVNALCTDPAHPLVMHAGTNHGVYRTADGGKSWTPAGLAYLNITGLSLDVQHSDTLYACAENQSAFTAEQRLQLFRRMGEHPDNETGWEKIGPNPGCSSQGAASALACDPVHPATFEKGNDSAQYSLGMMYEAGEAGEKNPAEAARWYRKAAEQGNGDAQLSLGRMCAHGDGAPRNNEEAFFWASLSYEGGKMSAKELRDRSAAQLSPEALAAARKRVKAWKPKKPGTAMQKESGER